MKEVEGIGKTYDEALKDGLSKIGLPKERVSVEIVKEPKKRLFSILDDREVKLKITELDIPAEKVEEKHVEKVYEKPSDSDIEDAKKNARAFLEDCFKNLGIELNIDMTETDSALRIDVTGSKAGLIIGYRGETLEALQVLVSSVANKGKDRKVRIILDVEGYRKKREKTLEELALKVANTVYSKKKSISLEPMVAFERKIIHETLQNSNKVKTASIGEEPYRKVVVSLK